jgi:uncharacterized protein (DUF305 family)
MTNKRFTLAAATLLITTLTLTACVPAFLIPRDNDDRPMHGNSQNDDRPNDSFDNVDTFNRADVMFTAMMVPHHEQAVEMSDLILAKDGIDPRVTDLATRISAGQTGEIEQMNAWLDAWGRSAMPDMSNMGHGDGMMSDSDLDELADASGADATSLYLEQMIEHHEGAIDMAESVIQRGENEAVRDLANSIVDSQTAEIAEIEQIQQSAPQ